MRPVSRCLTLLVTALVVSGSTAGSTACQNTLSGSYSSAALAYPNLKSQLELIAKQQVAQWYTDRVSDVSSLAQSVALPFCDEANQDVNPPTIVVYGLPQKDCAHGFSTAGSNANANDYRVFLQKLADAAGSRQVVYILEPDAIGLLADAGCGNDNNYAANLGMAMDVLAQNPNAEIYLDVGYWTLSSDDAAAAVAKIVNDVDPHCKSKGIALNTSNYRSNKEMAAICERFVTASGRDYKCIVDTSRNFVTPTSSEWCNVNSAGIGEVPTRNTGSSIVSRFVWVKPPGESDGECTGQSDQALRGPNAGDFFRDHFVQLWDNGVFVQKLGMASINTAVSVQNSTTGTAEPSEQVVTQKIEITSLTALELSDDTLGRVNAGDEWSDEDDDDSHTTTTAPTAPTPTTWVPIIIDVAPPHTMVVVDVRSDEYSDDDPDIDFTSVDEDSTVESVERIRKHKACE